MAEFLNALSTPHLAVAALAAFGAFCLWGLVGLIFGRLFTTTVDVLNETGPQNNSSQQLERFITRTGRAYGACAYLRSVYADGTVHVSLVNSRGRICPLTFSDTLFHEKAKEF